MWYTGIPDRLVLLPGAVVVFVELKRGGSSSREAKLRPNQVQWIKTLRRLGFTAGLVSGPEALADFLERYVFKTPDF